MLVGAPRNALRAFNAGVSLYILRVVAHGLLSPFYGVGMGRSAFPHRGKVSWRTRRVAQRKRNVSDLPYAAPPLFCVAFFVKEQMGQICAKRKGGRFALLFCLK